MISKNSLYYKRKMQSILFSFLFILLMALLLGILSWLLFGNYGLFFFVIGILALFILHPSVSHKFHLRIRGAREINQYNAPDLYHILVMLAKKTELPRIPGFYYIPVKVLNAFSIGNKNDPSIVLTSALINYLNPSELQGVIAHEVSHIKPIAASRRNQTAGANWNRNII